MADAPTVFMMDLLATVPYYTAYLSRALRHGGVDVRVGSISYYLDRDCFSSRALRLQPGCMDLVGRLPHLPAPLRRVWKLAEAALNHAALAVRFALRPPAILHVQFLPLLQQGLPLDLWFVRFVRWRGARVVLTVHDLLPHDTAERHRERYRQLYALPDALICHSGSVRDRLAGEFGVARERIHVIPHGPFFFDLPATGERPAVLRDTAPDQPLVLWQGLIFPYKGLDLLLDAWARVEAATAQGVLLVVGTGAPDLLEGLRAQVARLGLRRVVLELRFASAGELVALYRAADVVVYPYRAITTSGALATGLALGKTILASDLPVFRELLTDGKDAQLVPPGDPEALADGLLRLIGNPALRQTLAEAVAARAFGPGEWAAIARSTEAVYRQMLG